MTQQLHIHFSLSCIGEGNGNPLQGSCLENPKDGGAWWAAVCVVTQSWTWLKRLSSSSMLYATIHWIIEKAREFQKNIYFCFIDYAKAFVWITANCGKVLKRWEYQTTLSAFWEICMEVRKQQLEPDMKQQTGSKLGKEYVKAIYCHPAYLTSMQSTSWEMPGWMKHKLESRLLGEISITSDTHMTPPLWQKAKN